MIRRFIKKKKEKSLPKSRPKEYTVYIYKYRVAAKGLERVLGVWEKNNGLTCVATLLDTGKAKQSTQHSVLLLNR